MDLVHLHALWQYPAFAAARSCARRRIPHLISPCGTLDPYGLPSRRALKWLYGYAVERTTLAQAAAFHFTSTMEQRAARTFGVQRPSVVIPRPFASEAATECPPGAFRKSHPELADRKILLFLGRLHPKKRLDLVAQAFVRLAQRQPDAHLVIAGPEDGAGAQARSILGQAGLLGRATFTGLLGGQEKWSALRDSSVFLLPSEDENFGVAALEALAMGTPVLLSPHVGLADWVVKAQAGMVLQQDPSVWASAIEELLQDTESSEAMGEAGRRLVATVFSAEQVARAMGEAYARFI